MNTVNVRERLYKPIDNLPDDVVELVATTSTVAATTVKTCSWSAATTLTS